MTTLIVERPETSYWSKATMPLENKKPSAGDERIEELYHHELEQHRTVLQATATAIRSDFDSALALMVDSLRTGGKLLFFGNGGSAADAQHIAAEFVVRYRQDRRAVAAIALTTDTSTLTACGNDLGFEALYERQVEALGRQGDVAIGISTSGKSPNILKGLRQARSLGLKTVGLTGASGGDMPPICDALIRIPSTVTARIQEMHITVGHMLCAAVELQLGFV
jgi:D-sedoheptulose 7-phosphate isomerase